MTTGEDWRADVLKYWFGLDEKRWWNGSPELDSAIRDRFEELWAEKRQLPAKSFLDDPLTALAGVILFDQFPRNMFRGHADRYSTDPLALAIARGAVDRGFDNKLEKTERLFLYMPFQHSEDLDDQNRAVLLIAALDDPRWLDFAQKHRDIIQRYGRFPHRNAVLGRQPRGDERSADMNPF